MSIPHSSVRAEQPFPFGVMHRGTFNAEDMDSPCYSEEESRSPISLKSVHVTGEIQGLLFTHTIRQEYTNETDAALEIIYTFPLARDTVLLGMSADIGGKQLTGQVVERHKAETRYEEALTKGDSAIMVETSANGLYTANLGNIKAGESVTVELHCARLLCFEQGMVRLCIPTVISERYGDAHVDGGLKSHEAAAVSTSVRYGFSVRIAVHGDMAKCAISCPSHGVQARAEEEGLVFELNGDALLDRDFVLVMEHVPGNSLAQCVTFGEERLVAASFAPSMPQEVMSPLGLKILVDCSGSMSGERIDQALEGLRHIAGLLSEHDYVAYSRFGSNVRHSFKQLQPCTPNTLSQLVAAVDTTYADMGGTEMEAALKAVFSMAVPEEIPPAVLLITDGDIWAVDAVIRAAKQSGHRIFAIGVGTAPADSLLHDMAKETGGACECVTPHERIADTVVRMFHRMRGSAVHHVSVDWNTSFLWQSKVPTFLYDGETAHCFALTRDVPTAPPVLRWRTQDGEHAAVADHLERTEAPELFRVGMARRLEETPKAQEKKRLALKYQLLCEETALILVHERGDSDKVQGLPRVQQVPQMPASGHGCFASQPSSGITNMRLSALALGFPNFTSAMLASDISKPQAMGRPDQAHSAPPHDDDDVCSAPPRHLLLPKTSVKRSPARSSASVTHAPAPVERHERNVLLNALASMWLAHYLHATSVSECMEDVQYDIAYAPVFDFLRELQEETSFELEVLWAIFMQWALARLNIELDRHGRRLLTAALAKVDQADQDAVTARCAAWEKDV